MAASAEELGVVTATPNGYCEFARSRVLLANTKVGFQVMALSVHLHAFHFSFQPKLNSLVDDKMTTYHQGCAESPGACFARPRGPSDRALSEVSAQGERLQSALIGSCTSERARPWEKALLKALECTDIEKAISKRRVLS